MKINTMSTFKKSVLSVFVISAVAGSFISWDKYQPRNETASMNEFYQNSDVMQGAIISRSISSADSEMLAMIAEENLVADLEAEIEADVMLDAQAFNEYNYSPEADEAYDLAEESEQMAINQEAPQPKAQIANIDNPDQFESTLLFAFDSSEINPDYYQSLNEAALFMKKGAKDSQNLWHIVGYADLSGNSIYNSKLAQKRAQAVALYLVNKGVDEEQLSVVSLGASNPLNSERSVDNNRYERRVEIHAYQAEVTVLLEQYNQQLKQQVASNKSTHKTEKVEVINTPTLEVSQGEKVNSNTDFEKQKLEILTTAMEL